MLSPDQLAILQAILSDPAAAAATVLTSSPTQLRAFIANCDSFVINHKAKLKHRHFVFRLVEGTQSRKPLTITKLLKEINSNRPIINVGLNLNYESFSSGDVTHMASQQRTQTANSMELIYWGTFVCRIVAGQLIAESELTTGTSSPPVTNAWRRPISQFDQLLADHFEAQVKNERALRYWSNKAKRILLSAPDGTERIFHHSLFWWLSNFVVDSLRVYGESRGMGQDATDITVVTISGAYVIEIKWLGKNDRNTRYIHPPRINEGLHQVKLYLENDSSLLRGFLVVYDARSNDQNRNNSQWDPAARHPDCCQPNIIFLESQTPSVVAARAAQP